MSRIILSLLDKTDRDLTKLLIEMPSEISPTLKEKLTQILSRIRNADLKAEEIPAEWLE